MVPVNNLHDLAKLLIFLGFFLSCRCYHCLLVLNNCSGDKLLILIKQRINNRMKTFFKNPSHPIIKISVGFNEL